jgi:hypothetical protein
MAGLAAANRHISILSPSHRNCRIGLARSRLYCAGASGD